jgi:hypothetical protein
MSRLRERVVPVVLVLGRGYSPPEQISWMETNLLVEGSIPSRLTIFSSALSDGAK